jgi:putative Holliday junction resolvase
MLYLKYISTIHSNINRKKSKGFNMYCTQADLITIKNQRKRILGLDIGDRRIGVSVCDATWTIATPIATLDRQKNWKEDLRGLLKTYQGNTPIGGFVSGLPILMNGDEGSQAQKVRQCLEKHFFPFEFPIYLWDERLSTCAAQSALIEADMSRSKRKDTVDKVAASFILQGVLDLIRPEK